MATQINEEEFIRMKAHLKRIGEKQKDFLHRVILEILEEAEANIDPEELENQLQEARISGEKKTRNRGNHEAEITAEEEN